jgi:glucosyl-dolichyl phosphate glucuronosyltransferase
MKKQISIIICTRNRVDSLKSTLESIGRAAVPCDLDAELLVVDNGSTDSTRETVASMPSGNLVIRYVQEGRKGKGYAYNTGIASARGEVFLFTDDDVRVSDDWIEGMCRPILDGTADAVQGGIRIATHLDRPWLTGALRVWLAVAEDPERPPEGLVGANMAFGRKAVGIAGGFDTRLGPGAAGFFDDTLFGWALQRAGQRVLYRPQISVEHHFSPDRLSLGSFMRTARGMALSRAIVLETLESTRARPSILDLLLEIPGFGARCFTQALKFLINRSPDPGFLVRYYRLCLWMALRRRAKYTGR